MAFLLELLLDQCSCFPVHGWQNVALSSMGAVCTATSEYSQSMSCEMALDGITHMMGEWASRNGGAGTEFYVINLFWRAWMFISMYFT